MLRKNGYQNIYSADGNVNNLKEIILQNYINKKDKLLYVSGEIISSNLDKDLISEGYSVKRLINYSVKPVLSGMKKIFYFLELKFFYARNCICLFRKIVLKIFLTL